MTNQLNKLQRKRFRRSAILGSSAMFLASAFIASPAAAQDDGTNLQAAADSEVVYITGTRIQKDGFDATSPLAVVTGTEVETRGDVRIEDFLNQLPQIEAAQNAFISNGATGTATVDLRGLTPSRTLVLINGRRMQSGGVNSTAPDLNQIPVGLIERVEIVTGGASAVYGADALAGVVNFIMREDFEGVEVSGGVSFYQHNNNDTFLTPLMDARDFDYPTGSTADGFQYSTSLLIGGQFSDGRGHAALYIGYRDIKELRQSARDYSSCALNNPGTACGGSANADNPNFDVYPVDPMTGETNFDEERFFHLDLLTGEAVDDDGTNRYNYAPPNHFQRPDRNFTGSAFINYELHDYVKAFAEISFYHDRTRAAIAESGTFFVEGYTLPCDTAGFSDGFREGTCDYFGLDPEDEITVFIGKRNVEGGPRQDTLTHNAFRFVAGAEGDLQNGWRYEASVTYGQTDSSSIYQNDFFAPLIFPALDTVIDPESGDLVCRSGGDCIPYEVFTVGGVTEEAAAQLAKTAILTGETSLFVVNGYVSGDFWTAPWTSSPSTMVVGVEYRKEKFERTSDQLFEEGLLLGQGGPTPSVAGGYDVKEVFSEFSIPLFAPVGDNLTDLLTLDLGVRYSDYSNSGGAWTYKSGIILAPADSVRIRAGYNRAVRSPNNVELFFPQALGLWAGDDNCSGATPVFSAAQCANTGVSAAQYGSILASPADQYNQLVGGNPNLQPEKGDTITIGAVFDNVVQGLVASVDFWQIKIDNVIDALDPQLINDQCAITGDPIFCDLVVRSPSGSLWLGQEGYIIATNANIGSQKWQGIDIAFNYSTPLGNGTIRAAFIGTWLLKKFNDPVPGLDAAFDCKGAISTICFPSPEWRHKLDVTYYSNSFWTVGASWRFIGGVSNPDPAAVGTINEQVAGQHYFDINATLQATDALSFVFGVNNVFDKQPPFVGGNLSTNANTVAGFYDTLGRFVHMAATAAF